MRFYFVLIIFLIPFSIPAPVERVKQLGSDSSKDKPATVKSCYFSTLRKNVLETHVRPEKSIVSTTCSGNLVKVGEWKTEDVGMNLEKALSLLMCRGAGQCNLDFTDSSVFNQWKDIEVCDHHKNELVAQWDDLKSGFRDQHMYRPRTTHGRVYGCSFPEGLGDPHYRQQRPTYRLQTLTIEEAHEVLTQKNILVHPGIPLCENHKTFVENLITAAPPSKKAKIDTTSNSETEQESGEDDECPSDPIYLPYDHRIGHMRSSLSKFAAGVGVSRVCSRVPWSELKMTTKERKASAARHLIESILAIMVPDGTQEFKQMVQKKYQLVDSWTTGSSEDLNAIMNEVSAQYMLSESKTNRILILSLVANSVSYLKVEQYIPGLSAYMYNKAKKFARRDRNIDLTETKTVVKYNKDAVESFIEFITSPVVMVGLPYGVRNVKLSDGSKIEIPNSIRQQSAKEIIGMYKSVWEDNNDSKLPLGTSTMYKILNQCTATKRESTTCVDYFIAIGMESFDGLHQIVDYWKDLSLFDADVTKQMKDELFYAAQYLRTDYRLHIKDFSRISDHCAAFALSDTTNEKLSESCTQGPEKHFHDLRCDRCERTNAILDKIETHAKEFVAEEETDPTLADGSMLTKHKEELDLIQKYKKGILEMKKHLLRAAVTNKERQNITEELKDNEALITLDFAQKFLPKWHREKQVDYFGKKGISYHIAHTSANISGILVQHSFVHIYEGSVTQDSKLVIPTIAHLFKELKKVGVKKVHLRSDNAGAYHSSATIGSLHWLMEETKMAIGSYSFSESQNGKSSSDRDANRVKRRVKEYVNKGHDVTTSAQFFDALKDNPPNGISVYHGGVTIKEEGGTQWKAISNLNYFTIEEKGIRARRYRNVGEGVLFEKKNLKPIKGVDAFTNEAGFLASNIDSDEKRKAEREAVENGLQTKFWYTPKCTRKSNCLKEPDEVSRTIVEDVPSNVIGDLYSCPEPGCSSTFLKFFNLEKHILRGKHNVAPERMTERDYALNYFAQRLEDANAADSCPIVSTAVKQMKETTPNGKLLKGWALPAKAVRKTFGKDVVKFLVDCFDQGVKNKKPMNPFAVEKMMRDSKKFSVNDLLDGRQIAGFFSREADKRRHAAASTSGATSVAPTTTVVQHQKHKHRRSLRRHSHHGKHRKRHADVANKEDNYIISEEEHPDAGWIRFLKIEEFWDLSDEFYNETFENRATIFPQK